MLEIHEITQRAVQRMVAARSVDELDACNLDMVKELAEAVRCHRLQMGRYSAPIQKAVEFLTLNYSQEISLHRLAALVSLSESFLSRTFKKEVGVTITQFISQLRCTQAAELLAENRLSIQEISAYVGYIDNNYFVKVFKKQYGMTPSEYRIGKT